MSAWPHALPTTLDSPPCALDAPGRQAALAAVTMLTSALRGERFVTRAEVDLAERAIDRYFTNQTQKGARL